MLCYLRFPGRILQRGEQPPPALCIFVAEQLELDASHFGDYADRDQTRREHVLEIETALGLRPFTRASYRELAAWLLPTALATDHGPTLVATVLEELRERRIVSPPLAAIERLAGSVRARAQRQLWRRLADGLTDQQRQSLDQLLEVRVHHPLPQLPLRCTRTDLPYLYGYRPSPPGGVFPHGAALHGEGLLIVGGHTGIEACPEHFCWFPCVAKNGKRFGVFRGPFGGHFGASPGHGRRRSFSAMRHSSYFNPRQCLAIIPGHPLRGVGRQFLSMPLEFGQVVERVGAT